MSKAYEYFLEESAKARSRVRAFDRYCRDDSSAASRIGGGFMARFVQSPQPVQRRKIRNQDRARCPGGRPLQSSARPAAIQGLRRRGKKIRRARKAISLFAMAKKRDFDDHLQPISKRQLRRRHRLRETLHWVIPDVPRRPLRLLS